MYAEIIAAVQSAKTLGEMVKAANSLANYNELVTAVSDVNAKLMAATAVALGAQEKQAVLNDRVRQLEEEVARLKNWGDQKARYKLVSPWTGGFAYAVKESVKQDDPPHWVCTTCFEAGKRSILTQSIGRAGFAVFSCPACNNRQEAPFRGSATPRYADG